MLMTEMESIRGFGVLALCFLLNLVNSTPFCNAPYLLIWAQGAHPPTPFSPEQLPLGTSMERSPPGKG